MSDKITAHCTCEEMDCSDTREITVEYRDMSTGENLTEVLTIASCKDKKKKRSVNITKEPG